MASVFIETNLDSKRVVDIIGRVADELQFDVEEIEANELRIRKGDMTASIFLGAFATPYCDFRVYVEKSRNGRVEAEIQRNSPWWTGWIGISRVNSESKRLVNEIEDEIEDNGGRIFETDA